MMDEFRQVASDFDFVNLVGKKPLEFQRSYLEFVENLKYFKSSTVIDPQFYKLENIYISVIYIYIYNI